MHTVSQRDRTVNHIATTIELNLFAGISWILYLLLELGKYWGAFAEESKNSSINTNINDHVHPEKLFTEIVQVAEKSIIVVASLILGGVVLNDKKFEWNFCFEHY